MTLFLFPRLAVFGLFILSSIFFSATSYDASDAISKNARSSSVRGAILMQYEEGFTPQTVLMSYDDIANGSYVIHCQDFGDYDKVAHGCLGYSQQSSPSGKRAQVLTSQEGSRYRVELDRYRPSGKWRRSIVWEITRISEEGYLIRNRDMADDGAGNGCLGYSQQSSPSGRWSQVLSSYDGSHYVKDKDSYRPDGKYRRSIVWKISRISGGGYLIRNSDSGNDMADDGVGNGCLGYSQQSSPSGRWSQVLSSYGESHYVKDKDSYRLDGKYRRSIVWDFFPVKE